MSKDLLEEQRMKAIQNVEKYQKETKNWYNKKVKPRQLSSGDFILKRKRNEDTVGKFQQKWKGPYLITRTNKLGAFHLANMNGEDIDHTWNIEALRRYYPQTFIFQTLPYKQISCFYIPKFQFKCERAALSFHSGEALHRVSGFLMRQSPL